MKKKRCIFSSSFSSRDKWHEKRMHLRSIIVRLFAFVRSFVDVVKYWRQSAVLSHSHSLFIVLFGFINIRYVFVCIVLRNDHEDRATMICLNSQFNELCLTIESISN